VDRFALTIYPESFGNEAGRHMFRMDIKTYGTLVDRCQFHVLEFCCEMVAGDGEDMFRINLPMPGTRSP
jgi:hypothetical protein